MSELSQRILGKISEKFFEYLDTSGHSQINPERAERVLSEQSESKDEGASRTMSLLEDGENISLNYVKERCVSQAGINLSRPKAKGDKNQMRRYFQGHHVTNHRSHDSV